MTQAPASPPRPTTAAPAPTLRPSSLLRRLAGLVYDLVAVVAIIMVVGMIFEAATLGRLIGTGPDPHVPWWYQLAQYLVVVAYFLASWRRGGQTLGMRPWRMRLRQAGGARVHWKACLLRVAVVSAPLLLPILTWLQVLPMAPVLWLMLALWGASYAVALFHPRRRALHDLLAGTEIMHETGPLRRRQR